MHPLLDYQGLLPQSMKTRSIPHRLEDDAYAPRQSPTPHQFVLIHPPQNDRRRAGTDDHDPELVYVKFVR